MYINKNIAMSDMGFIFNPGTGDSFTTNHVGMFIIDLMKQNKSREEITKALVGDFKIDQASAEKDLSDFILMLENYQLIVRDHE